MILLVNFSRSPKDPTIFDPCQLMMPSSTTPHTSYSSCCLVTKLSLHRKKIMSNPSPFLQGYQRSMVSCWTCLMIVGLFIFGIFTPTCRAESPPTMRPRVAIVTGGSRGKVRDVENLKYRVSFYRSPLSLSRNDFIFLFCPL